MAQEPSPLAALAAVRRARARVAAYARRNPYLSGAELIAKLRAELGGAEPELVAAVEKGILGAWLAGARGPAREVPPPDGPPEPAAAGDDPEPVVRFPAIEAGVRDLMRKNLVTADEYLELAEDAREAAFTVARAVSADAVGAVRAAVARDLVEGGGLRDFSAAVGPMLEATGLADHQIEAVYRTQTGLARAAGMRAVLDHPLVGDEFPYVRWAATRDGRVRPDHLAMETSGIQGSDIYRCDDPQLRRVWPPCSWNCRCIVIPTDVETAAAAGIYEARQWLLTGIPPVEPVWVQSVPVELPDGWPDRSKVAPAVG